LPKAQKNSASEEELEQAAAPVRSLWSGTITFGLVSIPVDLLSAVRPRKTAMKLVDKSGHALGRQYHCSKEGKKLDNEELVRGYETDDGKMVVITDPEFESVAPEMSADIELRNFVPLEQIPSLYFQKPYFLAPAGKSAKAYHLLAATMERTGRVAIGSFVMRGHEYLVAIVSDHGVLRADTLRYADEIRTPEAIGLPAVEKISTTKVNAFLKAIEDSTHKQLDMSELQDLEAQALKDVVESKQKDKEDVIHPQGLEEEEAEPGGAQIIDLMEVLRKSLSKSAVVRTADSGPPISLAERRAQRDAQQNPAVKKTSGSKKSVGSKTSRAPKKKTAAKSQTKPRTKAKAKAKAVKRAKRA
jgi:DNA end-binding protein Ku